MRLNRLDLTRYGKFTDFSIDFGAGEPDEPDLHIIYGPNEAGKSTSFAGYLDLLFGIEHRSRYNFLHPYETMRVGARLEFASGMRELVRVKRPQNSLLDSKGEALAETMVLGELGAIDREAYRTMFSLDEDSLQAGGESILASRGELGQLLFSATAGLAGISQSLALLREEAERIYKFKGRTTELAELRKRLTELKQERETVDTLAHQFAKMIEAREATRARYDEAREARAEVQTRRDRVQRLIQALPKLAELGRIGEGLEPLAGLKEAPDHWAQQLPRLQAERIELEVKRQATEGDIETIAREAGSIEVDQAAVALAETLDHLEKLRVRFVAAEEDLPSRRLQVAGLDRQLSLLAHRLRPNGTGFADGETEVSLSKVSALVLDAATEARLRRLMESHSGVTEALSSAKREAEEAERRLAGAIERQPPGAGAEPLQLASPAHAAAALAALNATLVAVRNSDHETRRRIAERTLAERRADLDEGAVLLLPWQGSVEALRSMAMPPLADLEAWKKELADLDSFRTVLRDKLRGLEADKLRLRAELDAIGRSTGIVSDSEVAALRARREQAWAEHRRAFDASTADAFEMLMRQDDIAMSARIANAAELERVKQLSQSIARIEAEEADCQRQIEELEERVAIARQRVQSSLRAIMPEIPEEAGLDVLTAWIAARDSVLRTAHSIREAEAEANEAESDARRLQERLAAAISAASQEFTPDDLKDADLERLVATAQTVLDRAKEDRLRAEAVADAGTQMEERRDALASAQSAENAWRADWEKAISGTWLVHLDSLPDVESMREVFGVLEELKPSLREREQLSDRIRRMEQDQEQFRKEVSALAERLEIACRDGGPDVFQACRARIEGARAGAARLDELCRKRERHDTWLKELVESIALNETHAAAMKEHFRVGSLEEVAEKLRQIEQRAELLHRFEQVKGEILDSTGAGTVEEARALVEGLDRDTLLREQSELEGRFEDLDQEVRELFAAYRKASEEVEAVGADDAVARLELQRRTVQLEMEEKAKRYLRLRAGTAAAERALRTYRDRHRSVMMERASDAFRTISRGAYAGLATQPDKDQEVLIAKAADGSTKLAADLSRGTRFQLYLALRVAGYLEFARTREPVPFVADDIMETFDDLRSAETFRVFEQMALTGQVIYLTHHQHLVEMAKRICPKVRVHQLPDAVLERAA